MTNFENLRKDGFKILDNYAIKRCYCKDDNSYLEISYKLEDGEVKMNLEFHNYPVDKNCFLSMLDTIMDEKITWLGNDSEEEFERIEKEIEK